MTSLTRFAVLSPQATKLKKEQENLLKQRWELERLEEERRQMAALRQKAELGCVWEGPHPSPPGPKPASSHFLRLALVTLKAERIQSVESNSLTSAEFFMIINTKGNPYLLVSRRFLRHQYNVKLNRRTQQVQEELVSLKWQPGVACAFF